MARRRRLSCMRCFFFFKVGSTTEKSMPRSGSRSWSSRGSIAVARSSTFSHGEDQNASWPIRRRARSATVIRSALGTRWLARASPSTAASPPILRNASRITGPYSSQWPSASMIGWERRDRSVRGSTWPLSLMARPPSRRVRCALCGGRGDADAPGAGALDGAGHEPRALGVLHHLSEDGEAGLLALRHRDRLLHAHEASLEQARAGELGLEPEQSLGEPREGVHLAAREQLEGRGRALGGD